MARKKLEKPTKAMKDAAWRALNEVVTNPDAADHARVSAARAIVKDDPAAADAAAQDEIEPAILALPHNRRDKAELGISREGHVLRILYDAGSETGLADLAKWQTDVSAMIEAEHPVLLPAPDGPRPMTGAERVRRFRERKREAQAASAASAV